MARANIYIKTENMRGMENDFGLLATPEPIAVSKERLTDVAKIGFEGVQASIPVDDGDYRRPAGTLKDSARYEISDDGDRWTFTLMVGTEDDAVPYAKWVLYKGLSKRDEDYLTPMDEAEFRMEAAINEGFDTVFGED